MSEKKKESNHEGRDDFFMDIDRMINEGLGGGVVNGTHAGLIEESRDLEPEDHSNENK
ncbi:hypothetical protein [Bacillus sp. FJAT-45037]|uniref:hypothetical protein n=1 Tax=Bacillus sp. FJAT-45037 TaxID=2011007 RepID=UPI0018E22C24|nr:hypothetical protein [Bacillus sp. FJAT-45037]